MTADGSRGRQRVALKRSLLTLAIGVLRVAGVLAYQSYRATRRDALRKLALFLFLAETETRIARDRREP
jgi:hypothetical protein